MSRIIAFAILAAGLVYSVHAVQQVSPHFVTLHNLHIGCDVVIALFLFGVGYRLHKLWTRLSILFAVAGGLSLVMTYLQSLGTPDTTLFAVIVLVATGVLSIVVPFDEYIDRLIDWALGDHYRKATQSVINRRSALHVVRDNEASGQ